MQLNRNEFGKTKPHEIFKRECIPVYFDGTIFDVIDVNVHTDIDLEDDKIIPIFSKPRISLKQKNYASGGEYVDFLFATPKDALDRFERVVNASKKEQPVDWRKFW